MGSFQNSLSSGIRYAHKLLFNCLLCQPHKSVEAFVKKYVPILRRRETGMGGSDGWASYPPSHSADQIIPVIHAVSFQTHPYFKGKFIQGYLTFHLQELDNIFTGYRTVETWLYYDSKEAAVSDIQLLCRPFDESGFFKKIEMENAVLRVSYLSESEDDSLVGNPQFHLMQDQIFPKIYKIRFSFGHEEDVVKFL